MRQHRSTWKGLLVLLALLFNLVIAGPASAGSVTTLKSGWYPWRPYQYQDKTEEITKLKGLDIEIFREIIENQLGYTLDLPQTDWDEHQELLKIGERDIAAGAFQTNERKQYAYFSNPYRTEDIVLVGRRSDSTALKMLNKRAFKQSFAKSNLRLGIVDGYVYGNFIDDFLAQHKQSDRWVSSPNIQGNLDNLVEGKVDLVAVDRLVGATMIWENNYADELLMGNSPIFSGPIVALFSRSSTSPELVQSFNQALKTIRANGTYNRIVRGHLFPTLLGLAADQPWFRMLDNLGTAAFAFSGVVLARKEKFSLFGAVVLASLPAVGGGILRDLIVSRDRLAVVGAPHHLAIVLLVVMVSYAALRLPEQHIQTQLVRTLENKSAWIVNILDAVGLAAFTVVGVVVAVEERCDPLLLWGPIFSALTGAGGAIVRDVIRADASHPTLHHELYAEISLLWGFILSLFILNYADVESINLVSVKAAVALTGIGCLATRVIVIQRHIKAPLFASRSKQRWKPGPSPIRLESRDQQKET